MNELAQAMERLELATKRLAGSIAMIEESMQACQQLIDEAQGKIGASIVALRMEQVTEPRKIA